jgi:hypothetical protein
MSTININILKQMLITGLINEVTCAEFACLANKYINRYIRLNDLYGNTLYITPNNDETLVEIITALKASSPCAILVTEFIEGLAKQNYRAGYGFIRHDSLEIIYAEELSEMYLELFTGDYELTPYYVDYVDININSILFQMKTELTELYIKNFGNEVHMD